MKRKNISTLRFRFLVILFAAVIPFYIFTNLISYSNFRLTRNQLLAQLKNTTVSLHNTYEMLLRNSVTVYLRSKVEAGSDITYYILAEDQLDITEKKQLIKNRLQNIEVGSTGYFYAIDSNGIVLFHPDKNIVGNSLKEVTPVAEQLMLKEGYFEYEWQNTDELELKNKALYMTYIPELDWFITATSYRDEFTVMIDMDIIESTIAAMVLGENGYSYVTEVNGTFIAHPRYSNSDDADLLIKNDFDSVSRNLYESSDGFSTYFWRETEDSPLRKKIVFSKYIEDFDWIVASTMNLSEINTPLTRQLIVNTALTLLFSLILFWMIKKISFTIEKPVSDIFNTLNSAGSGNLAARTLPSGPAEIRDIGETLNAFILALEDNTESLKSTISEKEKLIHEIQHRINNNLQTINSMINLQRDHTSNSETRIILQDIHKRVSVIGVVYDHMLITDKDFKEDTLLLSAFLEDYISLYINSYDVNNDNFKVESNFEKIHMRRNSAISLGLILNELLSHCHSLSTHENRMATAVISVKKEKENTLSFSFRDNINSFDSKHWSYNSENLSYNLIQVLTVQLNGVVDISSNESEYSQFRMSLPN